MFCYLYLAAPDKNQLVIFVEACNLAKSRTGETSNNTLYISMVALGELLTVELC